MAFRLGRLSQARDGLRIPAGGAKDAQDSLVDILYKCIDGCGFSFLLTYLLVFCAFALPLLFLPLVLGGQDASLDVVPRPLATHQPSTSSRFEAPSAAAIMVVGLL